ncbi:MAG: Stk1 family Ser/Thr kinase [Actinomycetota bacterium]
MTNQGRVLGGRYQLQEVIGRGGMAEVYLGVDQRLGREVAIKVLRQDLAQDPAFITRFRREAQSAASLNHPNIVSVFDTGEDQVPAGIHTVTVPWIVMERVTGLTLRQVSASNKKISPERALDIVSEILAALDYSHRHGIVHRDIKPANIMITTTGSVKVMDFGIARALADASATMTHTNAVMGTAQYLSPEQARGESVDARSDLYSTGCLLYELLTGQPPFVGDSPVSIAYQHVSEPPMLPSGLNPAIPTSFDGVVLKALAKSPAERYQSAAAMRADIESLLSGVTPAGVGSVSPVPAAVDPDATQAIAKVVSDIEVLTEEKKPNYAVWGAAGAAVLALVAGAIFMLTSLFSTPDTLQVETPDLTGLTLEIATTQLENVGLVVGTVAYEENSDRPANTIISQNPNPTTLVDKGSSVDLVISKAKDQVPVPTVVNFASPDDARAAFEAVGLLLGEVKFENSDLPANTVLGTDPVAGTLVEIGTAIAITVSNGKVEVPNVVGQDATTATNTLIAAGFEVVTTQQEDDTVAANTVLSQSPSGGAVKAGSVITLVISVLPPDPEPTDGDPGSL